MELLGQGELKLLWISEELGLSLELSAAGCVRLSSCERGRDGKLREDTVLYSTYIKEYMSLVD